MAVKLTTTYFKTKKLTKRFRILQGGMSSSKTYSILISLFEYAIQNQNARITVITSTYPILIDGVVADLQRIFMAADMDFVQYYNKSSKDLTFDNGSQIQFRNLDSLDSHKGKGSRRDILFVNEANRLAYTALDPYIVRTDKYIIFDFNPDMSFWIHDRFVNPPRDDVDFIIVTYKDNEMIPAGELKTILDRIKKSKEPGAPSNLKNWVNIYAYGNIGTYSERQIYNYDISFNIPSTAKRIASGMDFGKSPDKTTLIDLYIDNADLYIQERFALNNLEYEKIKGSERISIVDQMKFINFPKGQPIIADSAGRTAILDLRKYGYNIRGVKKRQGRMIDAINKVRGYILHVLPNSPTIKKDLDSFFWKEDKNGKIIPEVEGHEPDTLVSIRYVIMTIKN